ncbi:MAG: hypothetical protein ACJ73V_03795 [Acidimicrobiia bacterium]
MFLAHYLGLVHRSEGELADAYREVAERHADEPDVYGTCQLLAEQCESHVQVLEPFVDRYGEAEQDEPQDLHRDLFDEPRDGSLGFLRDLHDLYLMASEADISWTVIGQAAQGARDQSLLEAVQACEADTAAQLKWLKTRIKQSAPQTLLVADR